MRREFTACNQHFVSRLPIDARGNGGQAGAGAGCHRDFIGIGADQPGDLIAHAVGQVEMGAIRQTVGMRFPLQGRFCRFHGRQRKRTLIGGVQINDVSEIRKFPAIVLFHVPRFPCPASSVI